MLGYVMRSEDYPGSPTFEVQNGPSKASKRPERCSILNSGLMYSYMHYWPQVRSYDRSGIPLKFARKRSDAIADERFQHRRYDRWMQLL